MFKTPHPVPQEVQEWLCTLDDESLMQVARDAVVYASQALDKEPNAVVLEILESINNDPREMPSRRLPTFDEELEQYGVFLSLNTVRVRKVLSATAKASLTEAERETYDNDFTIAYYPGEFSGRVVEAMSRDMAIYIAGLLDGVDQVEARLPAASDFLDEDLCASGHTV